VIASAIHHRNESKEIKEIAVNRTFSNLIAAGCLLALVSLPGTARAKDYPQRSAFDAASRTAGLGATTLPLLERVAGPGADSVASSVLASFEASTNAVRTDGAFEKESDADHVTLHTADWTLQVSGDGTRVNYRNIARLDGALATARPLAERLDQDTLEALGRRFIGDSLRSYIEVAPNEQIVPLYTEFQVVGGGGVRDDLPQGDQVVANTVVFTRVIDGVPVVGGGSKIALTFLNDGTAVAFDFDWPKYRKTDRRQEILPVDQIRRRGAEVLAFDLNARDVNVSRFECGLFDAGVRKRDAAALVQSACFVQAERRVIVDPAIHQLDAGSGHMVTAFAQAIPAGALIEPDNRWTEATALLHSALPVEPAAIDGPSIR
jgi:hypothetical protein